MTGPATGEPDAGGGAPARPERAAADGILSLLALGLAFRLIIAYLMPGSGFEVDLNAFRYWASNLANEGLYGFYERDFFHDYTPGYLYVLWLVGKVGQLVGGVGDLIKIPPIIADVVLARIAWSMALDLRVDARAARLVAFLIVINPITWFDSVLWGQVDAVGVVFLLLGLRELWRDRPERAAILTVVAAIIKPQLGILIPIVAAVTIRRALLPKGGFGADAPPEPGATTTALERRVRGPVRIVTTGLAGLLTAIAISLPFGLSFEGLVDQVFKTAGGYPFLSVNAYNPWALVTHEGHGIAKDGSWVCDFATTPEGAVLELGPIRLEAGDDWIRCADGVMIGPLPAVAVGGGLLLATMAIAALLAARRPDRRTMLLALTLIAIAFFVLPTRVHERYMFPFVALGAILAGTSRRWLVAYLVGSAATFANMYVVLTTLYPSNPGVEDWLGIGGFIRSYAGVAVVAAAHAAVLVFAAIATLRTLRAPAMPALALDALPDIPPVGVSDSKVEPALALLSREPVDSALTRPWNTLARPTADDVVVSTVVAPGPPIREQPAGFNEVGAWGWFRDRLDRRPTRADRSERLRDEPGGRFDRLDLWIVVVFVLGLLTMRIWRLGEPYQMHFDEVYHPRTATEFLQHWRYGIPHDIYEWTHPHLAKYAMAGGLVVWGEDETSATSDLGVTVRDAAVEPRWDDAVRRERIAGDRLWVVTGSELRAYDLTTRAPVGSVAIAGATTVGVDRTGHRIIVGTDDGRIVAVDTGPLDTARWAGTTAVLEATGLAELEAGITLLHVAGDGGHLVVALADGPLVTVDALTGEEVGRAAIRDTVAVVAAGAGRVGVAAGAVVHVVELETGKATERVVIQGPAGGITYVAGIDGDRFYVPYVGTEGPSVALVKLGKDAEATRLDTNVKLPGEAAGWAGYDEATRMVHVLGSRPGTGEPTVYVIEPHGRAVHADAALPFAPAAFALDDNQRYPTSDRQQLLAFSADGGAATVEIGRHPFAWRLPGVLAGVGMAAAIYLLARILFRRRAVALLAAVAVAADGMLFVTSRIGMNDAYVGLGIVAAYCLFAAIWLRPGGRRRDWLAFAIAMPFVGLLLGLALAAKWVAAYAIGGIALMVLTRSALGRLVLVAAMVALTTVLGYLAISVPEGTVGGNYLFLFLMVGLTLLAAVVNVLHPIAWTWEEHRLLVFGPPALGAIVFLGALAVGRADAAVAIGPASVTPAQVALALGLLGVVVQAAIVAVGRFGFGPLAVQPPADDPARLLDPPAEAPQGWLRLGSGFGLPIVWMAVCLVVLPLGVYVASYLPWAMLPGHVIVPGFPAGAEGQTLIELTSGMYRYHNNLSSGHAASSPWWAWVLDLKPVWFYHESFAGGTSAAIYNAGNLVAWWLAIPAMGFAAWQAFHRRSAALALITIAFACQWLSWSRIDRAAFQYHYYTSLPFLLIALGYFLAELWNGPSRRTWIAARLAGAAMVLGPFGLWLLHRPLCAIVRVEDANKGSWACPTTIPEMVVSGRAIALAVVAGIGAVLLIKAVLAVGRDGTDDAEDGHTGRRGAILRAGLVATGVGIALVVAARFIPEVALFRFERVIVEPIALIVTLALLPVAATIATARDSRRWVVGAVAAIVGFFVVWYPNIAALPLPTAFHNVFQGLLPTYLYAFQFPVSGIDRNVGPPELLSAGPLLLLVALAAVAVGVGYSAWVWRITEAERRFAPVPAGPQPGTPMEASPGPPVDG